MKGIRMREYYNRRVKADFAPKQRDETLDESLEAESPSPTLGGDDSPLSPDELAQREREREERADARKLKIEKLKKK